MSGNSVPVSGLSEGPSLILRLRDTAKAVKVHRSRLSALSRQCDALLSTVKEYSPRLIGTPAGTEADAIESTVERILERVSGWAGLSDTAAFWKQNEIQAGIEECHRELTACTNKFSMALAIMHNIENQQQGLVLQRGQHQVVDMLAAFLEEVRQYNRSIISEPPRLGEPLLQSQVMEVDGQQSALSVLPSPRSKSADISAKVSKVDERVISEGSVLVFYHGEWTDGDRAVLGCLKDQSPASQLLFKEWVEASLGVQHKNVLNTFGHITIDDVVYSVNPWMENGNIRDHIRGNAGADRVRLLSEVASGVEFLHGREIVHGDLCGKNILINGDGKAVVCGFGLSGFSSSASDLSRARWFAPERITSASVTSPTEKADTWSFGMLCLEAFTGEDPYSSTADIYVPVLLSKGTMPEHPGSTAVGLSQNMWELMQSCWNLNPAERPEMSAIQSTICGMLPLRSSRQPSSVATDLPVQTPLPLIVDSTLSNEANHNSATSSSPPASQRSLVHNEILPLIREPSSVAPSPSLRTVGRQTDAQTPPAHYRSVSDTPISSFGRLPPLLEVPLNSNIPAQPSSAPPQPLKDTGERKQARPATAPNPVDLRRQFSVDSSSSQSTSSTGESGHRRRWPFGNPKRSQTTPNTSPPSVNGDPLPSRSPSGDNFSIRGVQPPSQPSPSRTQTTPTRASTVASQVSRSASLLILLPQSRKWEPMSPAVLELLEKVASDSEGLLRPATDGTVSAGNLEGLVSRLVTGSADSSRDERFRATFLTVYQLFATSERLFEILKRRFEASGRDLTHGGSRYNILLFIERWLEKGFQDEELTCSSTIKEFVNTITGSQTMEEKAKEITSLIDNPNYVRRRKPGICPRLHREPAERPQGVTPTDLAAALTIVEGDRFKYITYWDYVNFTLRGQDARRIDVFNTVHDLVTVWVKRTVLHSNELRERQRTYEEWIYTAQACRSLNNFSSTASIVIALTSPIIIALRLTCESKAKQVLHALARDITPTDGLYQNTLLQAMTTDLIPYLDPLLSTLHSTFARSDPVVEVDGHPLIDFKQCSKLAEQIDSLVQYSPMRIRNATRPEVLAYVEYSLKSSVGDNILRDAETRSAKLASEEMAVFDRREKMRLLGMAYSPRKRK